MMAEINSHRASREQQERDAIRLLCSELIQPDTRQRLAELLQCYPFADHLSHAVYESVLSIGPVSARKLWELLPGRVTNMGFPDFELKEYLGRNGETDDIDRLFETLLDITQNSPQENRRVMGQSA